MKRAPAFQGAITTGDQLIELWKNPGVNSAYCAIPVVTPGMAPVMTEEKEPDTALRPRFGLRRLWHAHRKTAQRWLPIFG